MFQKISKREHEILTLYAKGYKAKEISKNLYISEYTVRDHIKNGIQKIKNSYNIQRPRKCLYIFITELM